MKKLIFLLLLLAVAGSLSAQVSAGTGKSNLPDTLNWVDQSRNRVVPVAIYEPAGSARKSKVVILNHGYWANKWGSFKAYSYLADYLTAKGYTVVSIQHELASDELLPLTGNAYQTRKPNWERGVQNILFVISQLRKTRPELDYKHLSLIGHSNGGDMAMLFATEHPQLVTKVITLDNRRMPFPRVRHPAIYSLRSMDQPADEGVLPTADEQRKTGIKVITLKNTKHSEMDDSGKDAQKAEIISLIAGFLAN